MERSARGQLERTPRSAGRAPAAVGARRADVFHLVGTGSVACGQRRPVIDNSKDVGGTGTTMTSDGVATAADELKQKLAQQIDAARNRLEALKKDVVSLHEDDMEMLRKKRDEVRARIESRMDRWHQAHDDIARWKAEKIAHPRRDHVVAAAARAGQARQPRRARRRLRAAHGEPGGDGLRGGRAGDPGGDRGALRG